MASPTDKVNSYLKRREGLKNVIEKLLQTTKDCEGHSPHCGCDGTLASILKHKNTIITLNENIHSHLDDDLVADDIFESEIFVDEIERTAKRLQHVLKTTEEASLALVPVDRSQIKPTEQQETKMKDLVRNQRKCALCFEMAYLGVLGYQNLRQEFRLLATDVRNQQISTVAIISLSKAASEHVLDVLIPVITDAYIIQDSDIVVGALKLVGETAKELKEKSDEAKERSKTVAERIQSCIAEVELVNDGERNDLVEQARRKLKMAETARDEAEAMLQEAQARKLSSSTRKLREQQRETTGSYSKPGLECLGVVCPLLAFAGPVGIAAASVGLIATAAHMTYKYVTRDQAHSNYAEDSEILRIEEESENKRIDELSVVVAEKRQTVTECENELSQMSRGTVLYETKLQLTLSHLKNMDGVLAGLNIFWGSFEAAISKVLKTQTTAQLTKERREIMFKTVLPNMIKDWDMFGKLCQLYVTTYEKKMPSVFGFLSRSDDPSSERRQELIESLEQAENED